MTLSIITIPSTKAMSTINNFYLIVCIVIGLLSQIVSALALQSITSQQQLLVLYDSSNHLHHDIMFHYENPEWITTSIHAIHEYALQHNDNFIHLVDISYNKQLNFG